MKRSDFTKEKTLIYDLLQAKCDYLKSFGFKNANLYKTNWELLLDRYENVEYESPSVYRVFRVSNPSFPIHYNINYIQDAISSNSSSARIEKAHIKNGVLLLNNKAISFNRYIGDEKFGNIPIGEQIITNDTLGRIIIGNVHFNDSEKGLAVIDGNHRINLAAEQNYSSDFDVYVIEDELMIRSIFTLYEVFAYLICDNVCYFSFKKEKITDIDYDNAIKYNKLIINYMEHRKNI